MKLVGGLFSLIAILLIMMSFFTADESERQLDYVHLSPLYNIYASGLLKTRPEEHDSEYTLTVLDDGELEYSPGNGSGYRYGPSIMKHEDGSIDVWFASPGNGAQWDFIRYRHSKDGIKYSDDEIVLRPTENSQDHYSVCDPGLVYFNGYYYLGYTSTTSARYGGVNNNIFVARSKNPGGPFEKWTGEGWGKKPAPVITYDGNTDNWGAGEVSFVIKDEKLYIYYSWIDGPSLTKVAISDLSVDWPLNIQMTESAIIHENGQDSFDVVYVEDIDRFMAFSVESRFNEDSGIAVYQSKDGLEFEKVDVVRENIHPYAHNMGISKDEKGHVKTTDELILGYAYARGSSRYYWGRWNTMFHKVRIDNKQ